MFCVDLGEPYSEGGLVLFKIKKSYARTGLNEDHYCFMDQSLDNKMSAVEV